MRMECIVPLLIITTLIRKKKSNYKLSVIVEDNKLIQINFKNGWLVRMIVISRLKNWAEAEA
jgi:hypothetical protein